MLGELDCEPGRVVAIYLESGPELLIAYLGALKAGAVPNVVNASLKPDEVRLVVADWKCRSSSPIRSDGRRCFPVASDLASVMSW